jgi:hypothetical protein
MEGQMSRKNLNDVIHGDRSYSRTSPFSDLGFDDRFSFWDKKGSTASKGVTARCYTSHPALVLPGPEKWQIWGGSCIAPAVKDADVYIGFDQGMTFSARAWPWKKGHEFLFAIRDMQAPDDEAEFRKLVGWVIRQLQEGKKIHVGCIGGHGRTGTFLAALVATLGEADAITYVREHYCKKAVEASAQVAFLTQHFGVTPAEATKAYSFSTSTNGKAKDTAKDKAKGAAKGGSTFKGGVIKTMHSLSAEANPHRIW